MPRRKTDGETGTNNTGQPVKQPRVRKKKEPSSICSTPTGEHPPGGLKLETPHSMGGMPPPGCGPMDGPPMPHGMMAGGMPMPGMHMQHLGLPNGTPCGPPGCPSGPHGQQMMDDGNNGPGGMLPYGAGQPHPQVKLKQFLRIFVFYRLNSGQSLRVLSTRASWLEFTSSFCPAANAHVLWTRGTDAWTTTSAYDDATATDWSWPTSATSNGSTACATRPVSSV